MLPFVDEVGTRSSIVDEKCKSDSITGKGVVAGNDMPLTVLEKSGGSSKIFSVTEEELVVFIISRSRRFFKSINNLSSVVSLGVVVAVLEGVCDVGRSVINGGFNGSTGKIEYRISCEVVMPLARKLNCVDLSISVVGIDENALWTSSLIIESFSGSFFTLNTWRNILR